MAIIPDSLPRIQTIAPEWHQTGHTIDMLRLDEVHPVVSGNKWYKLKENIKEALSNGLNGVLTFGGAYSNHLVATAAAAHAAQLMSVGIVRGLHAEHTSTETLKECMEYGMELLFVTRADYDRKEDEVYLQSLKKEYPELMIIPEGGANESGRLGVSQLAAQIPDKYTHICVSVGTGTTLVGITTAVAADVRGYAPMKGGTYLSDSIKQWTSKRNWKLYDDYHFGGFGKSKGELVNFMNEFYRVTNIPLDVVYTAKMMYGIKDQLDNGGFPDKATILCIHTGGLQGNHTIRKKLVYEG